MTGQIDQAAVDQFLANVPASVTKAQLAQVTDRMGRMIASGERPKLGSEWVSLATVAAVRDSLLALAATK